MPRSQVNDRGFLFVGKDLKFRSQNQEGVCCNFFASNWLKQINVWLIRGWEISALDVAALNLLHLIVDRAIKGERLDYEGINKAVETIERVGLQVVVKDDTPLTRLLLGESANSRNWDHRLIDESQS